MSNEALLERALRQVEWIEASGQDWPETYCPWCNGIIESLGAPSYVKPGHKPDCLRQQALAACEESKK